MSKPKTSTFGQGGKYSTSLNEDTFFRNYGEYKRDESGKSNREYYYDDYEDYSEND